MASSADSWDSVGPVLQSGPLSDAIIAAIREENRRVDVIDRGAYVRVLVPRRCTVSRRAIEARIGRHFRLPVDLEPVMPSFKGELEVSDERAVWCLRGAR